MGNNIKILEKMTTEEKIQIMEAIWDDLSKRAESIPSPSWHNHILLERENGIKNGDEELVDWESAKKTIRNNIR